MDVRVLSSISESEEEDDVCVAPSEMRAVPTKIKVKDVESRATGACAAAGGVVGEGARRRTSPSNVAILDNDK